MKDKLTYRIFALLLLSIVGVFIINACAPAAQPTSVPPTTAAQPTAMPQATDAMPNMTAMPNTTAMPDDSSMMNGAGSDLRATLTKQLDDHVFLAGFAIAAALRGEDAGFQAAADTLDQNTVALSKAVGSVYGPDAEKAFLPLWRAHIGFFVDYTMGAAKNDQAMKDKAMQDLDGYRNDFDAFLTGANPNLPKGAVADLLEEHVATLITFIDSQAGKDRPKAYGAINDASDHNMMLAQALSGGIMAQFPEKFPGADSKPAEFRSALMHLLQKHVYLAGAATGAALRGDNESFEAAANTLDIDTMELGQAIGSVYGPDAEKAFLPLWRAHIGFFVDYTKASAANDQAGKDAALKNLDSYRNDFDAFITGANPNLPKGAVADLLAEHVSTLTTAIDGQAAKDPVKAMTALKMAADHNPMLADPLAAAIIKQFPDKFGASN